MHFKTVASIVLWACASHVAADEPKPYRVALMAVPDMSLMRRDTNGYLPEQSICGVGSTCAEACGEGYVTCPANDKATHCFNPNKQQICCSDGTGNSCDKGFYCTHDTPGNTLCCPESMDLVQCAAAYSVTGGLKTAKPTPTSTSISTPSSSSIPSTSTFSTPSSTPLTTSKSTSQSTSSATPAVTKTKAKETSVCASSSGYTTAWNGSNSTVTSAVLTTRPTRTVPIVTLQPTTATAPPVTTGTSGAGAVGVSLILVAAAGLVALF